MVIITLLVIVIKTKINIKYILNMMIVDIAYDDDDDDDDNNNNNNK